MRSKREGIILKNIFFWSKLSGLFPFKLDGDLSVDYLTLPYSLAMMSCFFCTICVGLLKSDLQEWRKANSFQITFMAITYIASGCIVLFSFVFNLFSRGHLLTLARLLDEADSMLGYEEHRGPDLLVEAVLIGFHSLHLLWNMAVTSFDLEPKNLQVFVVTFIRLLGLAAVHPVRAVARQLTLRLKAASSRPPDFRAYYRLARVTKVTTSLFSDRLVFYTLVIFFFVVLSLYAASLSITSGTADDM